MGQGSGPPRAGVGSRDAEQDEYFAADPRIAPGLPRPVGWRVRMPDGTAAYDKFGTGDTQWIPVGGVAGGDVTQIVAGNNITISPPGGTGVVTINAGGAAASWPLANPRVFAVDGALGIDTNPGFADAASNSAADYRAACVAAGAVAKKTLAGLAAILPAIGAGRMAVILIKAGTYADDIATALGGVEGYAPGCPLVRGTITDATAGSVAFSGTDADEVMAGGVTAPGMNAPGYNPAAATVQQLVLTKVGGGSPAFAAEGAVPLGWRVRFDNATTTAALRGLCRQVARVSGADTINLQTNLPFAPVNTDVCYLEQAGVVIPATNLAMPPNGQLGAQFVGLRSSGTWGLQFSDGHFCFCGANAFVAQQQTDNQVVTDQSFTNPILGLRSPGGGFRSETTAEINRGGATLAGLVSAGATTFRTMQDLAWGSGSAAASLTLLASPLGRGTDNVEPANIGNNAAGVGIPHTFGTSGVVIDGSDAIIGDLICIGASATDAIQVKGTCNVSIAGDVSGTTGNTGSGLSLRAATGSTVRIANAHLPTLTGASSDIVWSGGAFDTWASLAVQEQYDAAGNHIVLAGTDIGTAAITPSVAKMTNNSGAPTGNSYLFVKQTGSSSQFKLAVPGDTPDGVLGTQVPNGGTALVGAISGYRVVTFNEAPTLGALVYISPAGNGKGTTIDPGGQQPLGVVVDTGFSGTIARVHFGAASTVPNLAATWALGLCRVYAVDFVNGNDAARGYADMTATGAGAYATACAAAGAVAKKTLAGLGAIFPRVGAGRDVEVVIANGGVNTEELYTDPLDVLFAGCGGYNKIDARGTGTNATAGCTAFDGSTADATYQGGITVVGLNAPGYNPSGASTTSLPCVLNGGGAAALPAEPAAPLGWRVRFDAATATAALRNQCRQIAQVTGDTITPQTAFSAAPANGDVFYIEQAGVAVPTSGIAYSIGGNSKNTVGQFNGLNISGIRCTGTLTVSNGNVNFAFSGASTFTPNGFIESFINQLFNHAVLGFITPAGGMRSDNGTLANISGGSLQLAGLINANGTFNPFSSNQLAWGSGCYAKGLLLQGATFNVGFDVNASSNLGSTVALAAPRINAGRLNVDNSQCTIAGLAITNVGAVPAFSVNGASRIAVKGTISGSTGNTDVGMDLTGARGALVVLNVQPTVTGTAGDVRLAGGQIITWAQAMVGIVDAAGNRIIGTTNPTGALKFSGTVVGGAGAVVSYMDDGGPGLAANQTTAIRYPTSQRLMTRLRVTSLSNTSANAVTATLYKNGAPTTMQVSIPSASAANTKFVDSAHPQLFADGDDFDLRLDDAADVGGVVNVSALVEYSL